MKTLTRVLTALLIVLISNPGPAAWGQSEPGYVQIPDSYQGDLLTPEELENLVAPIALYPDPMIAQILPAATFTDQIDKAADFLRRYGITPRIEDQPWDISVKAIAHYPDVIYMMDENYEWTVALGQAFVSQQQDLMDAIQRLRQEARERGNLYSTSEQQVIYDQDVVRIVPASPEYIYLPVYDPSVVYVEPYIPSYPFITFGMGYGIGAWLNRDCNWRERRVYYHGWRGDGWVHRARPHVRDRRGIYTNRRASVVRVNERVMQHDSRRFRNELRNDGWRIRERRGLTTPGSTVTRPGRTTRERMVPGSGVTRPDRTQRDRRTPGSTVTRPDRTQRDRTTPGSTVTRPGRTNVDRTAPGSVVTTPGRTNVAPGSVVTTPGRTNVAPGSVVTTPGRTDVAPPGSVVTTPGATTGKTTRERSGRIERRGPGRMIVPGTTTTPATTTTPRTGRSGEIGATGRTQRRDEGVGRGRGAGSEQRTPGTGRRRNSGNVTAPASSTTPASVATPARSRATSPAGGSGNIVVQPSPSAQPPSSRPAIVQPPPSVQPPASRRPAAQPPPSVQPPTSRPRVVAPPPSVVHPPPSVKPPPAVVQPPAATVTTPASARPDIGHRPAVPTITTTTPPLSSPVQQRHEGSRSGGSHGDRSGRHMQPRR